MSQAQNIHLLQDMFQLSVIALVSVLNHYHINGLHLFWDALYFAYNLGMKKMFCVENIENCFHVKMDMRFFPKTFQQYLERVKSFTLMLSVWPLGQVRELNIRVIWGLKPCIVPVDPTL